MQILDTQLCIYVKMFLKCGFELMTNTPFWEIFFCANHDEPKNLRATTGNVDKRRSGKEGMRPTPLSGTPSPSAIKQVHNVYTKRNLEESKADEQGIGWRPFTFVFGCVVVIAVSVTVNGLDEDDVQCEQHQQQG